MGLCLRGDVNNIWKQFRQVLRARNKSDMDVEEIEEEVPTAAVAYEGRFCPTPVASKGSLEHRSNQREALDSGQHQYGSADECFEQQAAETAKPAHNQETSRQQNASGNMQQQENLTKVCCVLACACDSSSMCSRKKSTAPVVDSGTVSNNMVSSTW